MRTPRRLRAAPSRIVDGAAVVIQTRAAEVSLLNETGTWLWNAIDGTRSEAVLLEMVLQEFEVERATAEREVSAFLDELAAAGLVELA